MKVFILFIFSIAIAACSTVEGSMAWDVRDFQSLTFPGYVYCTENLPCEGVEVQLFDNVEEEPLFFTETDIHGRFFLSGLDPGPCRLSFSKIGMEEVTIHFKFTAPSQLIYVKMRSISSLFDEAESALESRRYAEADGILCRILSSSPGNPDALFLLAVLSQARGDREKSGELLVELAGRGVFDEDTKRRLGIIDESDDD